MFANNGHVQQRADDSGIAVRSFSYNTVSYEYDQMFARTLLIYCGVTD